MLKFVIHFTSKICQIFTCFTTQIFTSLTTINRHRADVRDSCADGCGSAKFFGQPGHIGQILDIRAAVFCKLLISWRPLPDSNRCCRREGVSQSPDPMRNEQLKYSYPPTYRSTLRGNHSIAVYIAGPSGCNVMAGERPPMLVVALAKAHTEGPCSRSSPASSSAQALDRRCLIPPCCRRQTPIARSRIGGWKIH